MSRKLCVPLILLVGMLGLGAAACGPEPEEQHASQLDQQSQQLDPQIKSVIQDRCQDPSVNTAIMGALLYLDDMQIRERFLWESCEYDSSDGTGCVSTIGVNLPCFLGGFNLPTIYPQIKNQVGEWASNVHFLPKVIGCAGKTVITVQDSNLFMTAAITYPLFLFNEEALSKSKQIVKELRRLAISNVEMYKRNDAYSFWIEFAGRTSSQPVVGPYNIPLPLVQILGNTRGDPAWDWAWDPLVAGMDVPPKTWFQDLIDPQKNPYGLDMAFNIPNDADDTSVAVIIQKLHAGDHDPGSSDPFYADPANFPVDLAALDVLEQYRDENRTKEDPRDDWKAPNSGAYMTWLKDEDLPIFGSPESGVVPLAVNNVGCVVVANAIFAKSLMGQTNLPGYDPSIQLLVDVINNKLWPECGLYYPQQMMFPYAASRAFRDGKVSHPDLQQAMEQLLADLLQIQKSDGSFPGGEDTSYDLSTALGVVSLLNIGAGIAQSTGKAQAYADALQGGLTYLLKNQKYHLIKHGDTFDRERNHLGFFDCGRKWRPGLFFAASYWDLGRWLSEAYTTSIVLEALSKFVLAYDMGQVSINDGRKIHIQAYAHDADDAPKKLKYEIK